MANILAYFQAKWRPMCTSYYPSFTVSTAPKLYCIVFQLIFKWSVVLGSQVMYFPLNFAIFYALHAVVQDGRNLKFCKKFRG